MQFKYTVLTVFFIGILPVHYAYSDYKIIPKSIDYKRVVWFGNVGKYKTDGMRAYIQKIDEIPFSKFGFDIEGVLFIHDKKAPKKNRYRVEYWTKEGAAFIDSNDYSAQVKKKYHWYKDAYKKRKRKKSSY